MKYPMSLVNPSKLPENQRNLLNRNDLQITVQGTNIILFKGRDSKEHGKKRDPISDLNLLKRSYQGKLSKSAVKFISYRLNVWYESIQNYQSIFTKLSTHERRKLVMITLTLPAKQKESDQQIKRVLFTPFLDKLKYHYALKNYFWRAEAQKNGNIHFHIIVDRYINKEEIQDLWNDTVEKYGYISDFEKIHKHRKPPTTQITLIRGKKGIRYVLKYATKNEETKRRINGKLWGMNDELRSVKRFTYYDAKKVKNELEKLLCNKTIHVYEEEHFMSINLKKEIRKTTEIPTIKRAYIEYLTFLYSILYFEDIPFPHTKKWEKYNNPDIFELSHIIKLVGI